MVLDKKSWLEVKEVLSRFNKKEKERIPNKIIEFIDVQTKNMDYKVRLDDNRNLEQQISKDALSILTYITLQYLANKEQKEKAKNFLISNNVKK